MEERFMVVTEERNVYLFIVVPENTQQKTSHVENSKLFVNNFYSRCKIFEHDSLCYARKYARIFFLGYYLFLEAYFLPRSSIHFVP